MRATRGPSVNPPVEALSAAFFRLTGWPHWRFGRSTGADSYYAETAAGPLRFVRFLNRQGIDDWVVYWAGAPMPYSWIELSGANRNASR